jgi:c-di-GMP-binding flagellar brake protein YcgR
METIDRRAYSRLRRVLACEISCGQLTARGWLLDASLGGLLVSSSQGCAEGADIKVAVEIPGSGKTVSVSGCVIRVTCLPSPGEDAYWHGVRLTRVTPESRAIVKAMASKES